MAYIGNIPAEAYTNTVKDSFNGNGSTTAFTLSRPTVTNDVRVVVENVIQDPTVAYSVSGTTLTFTSAPPAGTGNIYVVHLGPAVMTAIPPSEIADATTFASSVTVQGAFTSLGIDDNATSTAMTLDSSGKLLVGTTSDYAENVQAAFYGASNGGISLASGTTGLSRLMFADGVAGTAGAYVGSIIYSHADNSLRFNVNGGTERMRITSSGNVGIGTSSPSTPSGSCLSLYNATLPRLNFKNSTTGDGTLDGFELYMQGTLAGVNNKENGAIAFGTNDSERMRLDSSGTLLVGKTASDSGVVGFEAAQDGHVYVTVNNTLPFYINRQSGDELQRFASNGATVGKIGTNGGRLSIGSGDVNLTFNASANAIYPISDTAGTLSDGIVDMGAATARFDDIYATNGTIQTSDRNEKQDIEALNEAETRVAQACKGLLRKFRWQDAVAEKGDDARIHFGIIAQDLQDAFAAEGLDAGRYAMFISSTWWETQTEVPAVEAVDAVYEDVVIPAVLDEEGNELEAERTEQQLVTEAVEAKDAYTRTDTYETQAEAPEGATERTRLGVRYPELLAFIIGAV